MTDRPTADRPPCFTPTSLEAAQITTDLTRAIGVLAVLADRYNLDLRSEGPDFPATPPGRRASQLTRDADQLKSELAELAPRISSMLSKR